MHATPALARRSLALITAIAVVASAGCSPTQTQTQAPSPASASALGQEPTPTPSPTPSQSRDAQGTQVDAALEQLEREYQARVAVSAIHTDTGESVHFREEERFGFASTLKAFAAAEVLRQVPGAERDHPVEWAQTHIDQAGYSPVTSEHIDSGLTIVELAEAAVRDSDNTAMNLVLDRIGGPAGMNQALARLGDDVTVVADMEPALNNADSNTGANTTTTLAFTSALKELLESDYLAPADRDLWLEWMSGNITGDALIRAGAPDGWVVADKSGGAGALRNDIAVVTPPGQGPIVITVLTERWDSEEPYDDALVADVARVVLETFARNEQ